MAVRALLHYALEVPDQTARDFPEQDALYKWGPPVPEDFGLNRELEG